ncbi:TetR/AcrR family transcriptional regulator [Sphingomonas sp. CL5.1]|uniref:TetR/AcrR family transcriptional regulator n=1 Tax=Sphingomonas sp. CL5.1 TaxID=2653203 RepID=UPI001581F9B1|nr:TetR/AcrR family transcriptional regulator [Sphingomonas sp. CL5.1]QKS00292.1 TetR/AcrR family transcriptional regulator [Sphingomonas sp. CL5.1]
MAKRDAGATRARILREAITAFSTVGYAATGVRQICEAAGVSQALVNRYFGSKLGLFRAAIDATLDVTIITALGREHLAEKLAAAFAASRADAPNPLPMMMFAAADPDAQSVAQSELESRILDPLAAFLGGADARQKASRLIAIAAGFFTYRILYPLAAFSAAPEDGQRQWLAEAFATALGDQQ